MVRWFTLFKRFSPGLKARVPSTSTSSVRAPQNLTGLTDLGRQRANRTLCDGGKPLLEFGAARSRRRCELLLRFGRGVARNVLRCQAGDNRRTSFTT